MSPELERHLGDMQQLALQVEYLAETLDVLIPYPAREETNMCLASAIKEIAGELSNGLDIVNLRESGRSRTRSAGAAA